MKRKIFAAAVVLGLIVMAGLSFQLSRSAGTHNSENSHHASKVLSGGELDSGEAMDPNMPGMDHSNSEEVTDAHTDEGMDPNMPGMDHSDPNALDEEADRPLKAILGTFGVATSIVLSGALILRRRDKNQRELKINVLINAGEVR